VQTSSHYKRRPTEAERESTEKHIRNLCDKVGITVDDLYKITPLLAARQQRKGVKSNGRR
jgi:hypothetical protein